jgi:hypothetical protein
MFVLTWKYKVRSTEYVLKYGRKLRSITQLKKGRGGRNWWPKISGNHKSTR